MTRLIFFLVALWIPVGAVADVVVATRTLRPNVIVESTDVQVRSDLIMDGYTRTQDVIGQETQTTIYAGRPIPITALGPPALVTRNQIVSLRFQSSGVVITTEGRSLQRGGIGDKIRVMNLDSKTTLFGQIQADGSVRVFK